MKEFITSDTHYFHKNIIQYSNRPFRDLNDMHFWLIDNWNYIVGKGDVVYHLGDFFFSTRPEEIDSILGQLNGKIRLIKGNHDSWLSKLDRLKNKKKIEWVRDYHEEKFCVNGISYPVVMMHYPMHRWNRSHHGSIQFHGHSHGGVDPDNQALRRFDVGVDAEDNKFTPVKLSDLILRLNERPLGLHNHGGD
jgi:calcineurin-like phosphoesterase family protein